jgi:hypothetical protein
VTRADQDLALAVALNQLVDAVLTDIVEGSELAVPAANCIAVEVKT